MWLFTRYGFYSIACASGAGGKLDPDQVMIRARRREHLESLQKRFEKLRGRDILVLHNRDYRYRIVAPKEDWVAVAAELAREQDWSNFKDEALRFQGKAGTEYCNLLHEVWELHNDFQR